MNPLDVMLLLLLVLFAVRGYRRGALSLVGAFGGALGGFVLGATFAPQIASGLIDEPGLGLALLTLALLLGASRRGRRRRTAAGSARAR